MKRSVTIINRRVAMVIIINRSGDPYRGQKSKNHKHSTFMNTHKSQCAHQKSHHLQCRGEIDDKQIPSKFPYNLAGFRSISIPNPCTLKKWLVSSLTGPRWNSWARPRSYRLCRGCGRWWWWWWSSSWRRIWFRRPFKTPFVPNGIWGG